MNQKNQAPFIAAILFWALSGCSPATPPSGALPLAGLTSSSEPRTPSALQTKRSSLPATGFYNNADGSPLMGMIEGAQTSIDIEIYEMTDPDVLSALEAAVERKVTVRIVKDGQPLGGTCNIFAEPNPRDNISCQKQKRLKSKVIESGGQYIAFNKAKFCANPNSPCFQHGKMIITDSKAVMISTGNFNSSNLCNLPAKPSKCNRDYSVLDTSKKTVNFLKAIFESDLKGDSYDLSSLMKFKRVTDRITVSPNSLSPILKLIHSAKKSIRLQNQYLKDPKMNAALIEAAKKGVRVELTVSSVCNFGKPAANAAEIFTRQFKAFEEAGISLRFLPNSFRINGKPGYLHSKAMVIDDQTAWVGSVNGSTASLSNNREFGLIFNKTKWVEGLLSVLVSDHTSKDMANWKESLSCAKD